MKIDLTPEQLSIIRLGLLTWEIRCEGESRLMRSWAREASTDEIHRKCIRNAIASEIMEQEARALLKILP